LAALPVRESFARDGRVLARCRASFGRSVRGVAAEVWARSISQRFAGAGAHELCDVLVVSAFSATDHRAQRDPERKTGRDGCRDVDGQDLQKRRHGHTASGSPAVQACWWFVTVKAGSPHSPRHVTADRLVSLVISLELRGDHVSVGAVSGSALHRDLVSQHEDFDVLGRVGPGEQYEPAQHASEHEGRRVGEPQ
jgi:hypothetical protein